MDGSKLTDGGSKPTDGSKVTRRSLLVKGAAGVGGLSSLALGSNNVARAAVRYSRARAAAQPAAYAGLKAKLAAAQALPKFVPPGPPIDIRAARGKTLSYIAITLDIPVLQQNWAGVQQGAKAAGLVATSYNGKGSTSLCATGITQAINQKIDCILIDAVPPNTIAQQVHAARQAGIKVIFLDTLDPAAEKKWYPAGAPPNTGSGTVSFDFVGAAELEAAWVLVDSGGKNINCVTFGVPGDPASETMVNVIAAYFKEYAQGPYKLSHQWVLSPDWATREPVLTRTIMTADPTINYIIPVVDAQCLYIVPTLQQLGKTNVKLVAFNGTPAVEAYVKNHQLVRMDVAVGFVWEGWQDVDQALRALLGKPPAPASKPPNRAFTWNNIHTINPNGNNADWFATGKTAIPGFKKLWGI